MPIVSSLFVYPIKSCAGISLQTMRFDAWGPEHDRRLMVVDTGGKFLTQRENPLLARIQPWQTEDQLWVRAPDTEDFRIRLRGKRRVPISIWNFHSEALDLGDLAAEWFSETLEQSCRLVALAPDHARRKPNAHGNAEVPVAFADQYPVSLVSLESLSELNRRLETPVALNRFRPNVVVRDCHPFAEDRWSSLEGRALTLQPVKACTRCKITTIDQTTLVQSKEPLATLGTFRQGPNGVNFGQLCLHTGTGTLAVGDVLTAVPQGDTAKVFVPTP
jgi:uncharacterized protein